jgi:hypothetical protein
MAVKNALLAILLAISCQTNLAAADEKYGSFGAQVSDGSELKHYSTLLDQLGHLANFQNLGTVLPSMPNDNYEMLSKFSDIYVQIVKENGNSYIPDYKSDTLALKNINGLRVYADQIDLRPLSGPNNKSCGAAVVFLYPTLVAWTLLDLKPEYIEPQSGPVRIAELHKVAQREFRHDRIALKKMCDTPQFQPSLKDFDNFLSMLRSDSTSFLMMIAAENKGDNRQPALTPKPKEPLPAAPQRPYVAANDPYPGYSLLTEEDPQRCALAGRWYVHAASMRNQGESPDLIYQNLMALTKLPGYNHPPADMKGLIDMVILAFPGESPAMVSEKMMTSCKRVVAKHRIENNPFDWTGMGI